MSVAAFLSASQNLPFSVALAVMLLLAVIEGIGFAMGLGIFDFLDSLAPDVDVPAGSFDGAELAGLSLADRFMGWLHFGRVPVLILLVVFLCAFGLIGLALQLLALRVGDALLPGVVASAIALPLSLPAVRVFGRVLARVLPNDETYVATRDEMVGCLATIVLGEATQGKPAQAKLRDAVGQVQYLMVEPDEADARFVAGQGVLLVARSGSIYRAVAAPAAALVD